MRKSGGTAGKVVSVSHVEDVDADAADEQHEGSCGAKIIDVCKGNTKGGLDGEGDDGSKFGSPIIPTIKQKSGFPLFFCCPKKCQLYTLWSSTTAYEVRPTRDHVLTRRGH